MAMRCRLGLVLLTLWAADARGACNLIPSATQTFRGAVGATNKPFAAPGDFVEVSVRPGGCDGPSHVLGAQASDHVVTVVFTPPSNGPRRVAFLTADSCASPASVARRQACEAVVGAGRVACVDGAAGLAMVSRNGIPHLSFRFPDTDALFAPDADEHTLAGPATIAVTAAADPGIPCDLATKPCAIATGVIACVDDLYAADGTCAPNVEPTFPHFTALPVPNDYASTCFQDDPVPCDPVPVIGETRYAVDAFGNLLMPMNWQGVLVSQAGLPVPRLLRATVRSPLAIPTPPVVNLGSFTPEGALLPPIFVPNADPTDNPNADRNVMALFGSADASYTILRIARRAGTCVCGDAAGSACVLNGDCPDAQGACGSTTTRCPTACVGGASAGAVCVKDGDCPGGGRCGALFPDFRPLARDGGPLVLRRQAPGATGICQLAPHASCTSDADCTGTGDPCVAYALEANTPVPLESLAAGSTDVFAFTVNEAVAAKDLNGDGDQFDSVVTLRDRQTGAEQPLGGQSGCNLTTGTNPTRPLGRAIVRQQAPPFSFPAVETEGDVVAFLESEPSTTPTFTGDPLNPGCDENQDGDDQDAILRAFRLGPTALVPDLAAQPRAVDAGLEIDGRSLALSAGMLFFRTPEAANAPQATVRVGTHTTNFSWEPPAVSADGRYVAFGTADDLLPSDTNGTYDVYVRDTATNALELVSATAGGTAGNGFSRIPSISANGRWVTFITAATDILGAPGVGQRLAMRDRCVSYGQSVAGCTPSTDDVGLTSTGAQPTGGTGPGRASVTPDGRFVAYGSDHTNIVADDTAVCLGYGAWTGSCPDVFVRDRCLSDGVAVPGCTPTTEMVSRATDGTPGNGASDDFNAPAISDDGNVVVFTTQASNFTNPPLAFQVFARDRRAGTTTRVSESPTGVATSAPSVRVGVSGDGRYVVIESEDYLIAPGTPATSLQHVFVKDRLTGASELVSRAPDGTAGDDHSYAPTISHDGRYVAYVSCAANIVPGDTNSCATATTCANHTAGYCPDVFVFDRATGSTRRVSVEPDGSEDDGDMTCNGTGTFCGFTAMSDTSVVFTSNSTGLLGPGNDTNGVSDTFVRAIDAAAVATHDVTGDGDADDVVLQRLDTGAPSPAVATLCPATRAGVAAGMAAFLRPESAGRAAGCPGGDPPGAAPDLDGDGDVADEVVHLWRGGNASVENLRCAATDVTMSPGIVAALVDEAAQGGLDLDGDGDARDQVVKAYRLADAPPSSCADWQSTGLAADTVKICGTRVAFLVPECAQSGAQTNGCAAGGTDLNGDGDAADRVLHLWDPATQTLIDTQQAAEDFVCSDAVLAFRTRESAQCPGGAGCANGLDGPADTDLADDVVQVYDLTTDTLTNTHRAVRPCRLAQCDPRFPYRVLGGSVKFLGFECDQGGSVTSGTPPCAAGGTDMNGDGDADDLVIEVFDVQTAALTILPATPEDGGSDPLQGGGTGGTTSPGAGSGGGGAVFQSSGRCLETLAVPASCAADAACGSGAFCSAGVCKKEQGVCATDADCPPGIACDRTSADSVIVPASADRDGDGVPDHLDDCPDVADPLQVDADGDGVGDACDLAVCGNGVVEYDEQCDGSNAASCVAGCLSSCTCAPCGPACASCANVIADPLAKIALKTRNDAGQLKVKAVLPLAGYGGAPIAVQLDDGNSAPIVRQAIGALTATGASQTKWAFKTKAPGVQKVQLKQKAPGSWLLLVKAKRWFSAAAADDGPANTRLTVTVGTQCFTHVATSKID